MSYSPNLFLSRIFRIFGTCGEYLARAARGERVARSFKRPNCSFLRHSPKPTATLHTANMAAERDPIVISDSEEEEPRPKRSRVSRFIDDEARAPRVYETSDEDESSDDPSTDEADYEEDAEDEHKPPVRRRLLPCAKGPSVEGPLVEKKKKEVKEKLPEPPKGTKKSWMLTINNHTPDEIKTINDMIRKFRCSRVVAGQEVGASGTRHLHVFVTTRVPVRWAALKRLFPRADIEWCHSPPNAERYVQKDGDIVIDHDDRKQGARSDLQEASEAVLAGLSLRQVARNHPTTYVKYYKGLEALRVAARPSIQRGMYPIDAFAPWVPYHWAKYTVIFYGRSGIGKTQFALAHFQSALCVTHKDALKEFDPDVHDGIVFDDMSFVHEPIQAQIHLTTKEIDVDLHLRYITGRIPANTKKIITTNDPHVLDRDHEAIARRCEWIELTARD